MSVRLLGVSGENRATRKTPTITPSDFEIAGLIGRFPRQYEVTHEFTPQSISDLEAIFGEPIANFFGNDALLGFFQNSDGGRLFVKSALGNDGSGVIDAVVATSTIIDQSAADTLRMDSAHKEQLAFGVSGNQIGRTITNGNRYETTAAATATAAAASVQVAAIGGATGIKVGDILQINLTGGGTATVNHKILTVAEGTQTVTFAGPLNTGSETLLVGDEINVIGFRVQTFSKSNKGVVSERNLGLGTVFCTMEPEVADFYVENVHKENTLAKFTDLASGSALNLSFPADDVGVVFLASGADGTTPTTVNQLKFNHAAFDNDPVRMISNSDTTLKDYFDELELYTKQRVATDFPEVIVNTQGNLTKSALITLGRSNQTSDGEGSYKVIVGTRYEINDPFNDSPIAPKRQVPSVGHNMGAWIRTIRVNGIHNVPATPDITIRGITGVVESQQFSNQDRTDLAEAGINITQEIPGTGIQIRNWFTPSTLVEFQHGNAQIMRNFIRESVKESVAPNENEPNVFARVQAMRDRVNIFMFSLFRQGSNTRTPEGEFFGQVFDEDGQAQSPEELFEVIADITNNPNSALIAGERDLDVFFQRPTPTGSIVIGVGLQLPRT